MTSLALSTGNWILLAGVIINGLAFVGVIVSLLLLRAQGLAAHDATLVIAYQNMTAQMADMERYFLEHLDLRPYFFGGKEPPGAEDEHDHVLAVAEMYINLMDNVLTQCPALNRWASPQIGRPTSAVCTRRARCCVSSGPRTAASGSRNSPLASLYPPSLADSPR